MGAYPEVNVTVHCGIKVWPLSLENSAGASYIFDVFVLFMNIYHENESCFIFYKTFVNNWSSKT